MNFALLLAALAPIIWGTTYSITKLYLPDNIPIYNSIIRCLPIGIILLLFNRSLLAKEKIIKIIIVSLLNISLFQYLLFYSAYKLNGGTASILTSTQSIFVVFLSVPILGSKLNLNTIFCAFLGFIGVILLLLKGGISYDLLGYIAAITSAVSMAFGTILTKKWFDDTSILTLTSWQLTIGSLFLIPMALNFEVFPNEFHSESIIGYIWLSVFGSGLSYYLWFRGIKHLNVQLVTILGFLSPLCATILGYFLANERMILIEIVGILFIISSILLMRKDSKRFPLR
ncbi:MAG: EamA family transporter [Leptospira sp.]|nr:EamA family transporter [Leptospira sp.]NCS92238.1 EamA family transporter [Leptospira sp.]